VSARRGSEKDSGEAIKKEGKVQGVERVLSGR